MAVILSPSTVPLALGAEPDSLTERDAANAGRARAAAILGRRAEAVQPAACGQPVSAVGGRRYWTGVFRGRAASRPSSRRATP
jgi:hypothetical protein